MSQHLNLVFKSPVDERDWNYDNLPLTTTPTFPKVWDLRPYLPPVREQGIRGTCAAFTSCCMKEYHEKLDHKEFTGYMSPESVYFYRQNKPQEGMFCRDVMKILHKHGVAREQFQPYSRVEPKSLSPKAIEDAKRFKVQGYAQVHTIHGAKAALMSDGPLLIAFPYYKNGKAEFWQKKGKMAGGHAVAIVGWVEEGFIVRNSWGKGWNNGGYVIYPWKDWGAHWELWSAVDQKTDWAPPETKKHLGWIRRMNLIRRRNTRRQRQFRRRRFRR